MGNRLSFTSLNPFRRSASSINVSGDVNEPESGSLKDVTSSSSPEEQVNGQQPQELQGAEISSNVTVNGSSGDEQQVSGSESSAKQVNGTSGVGDAEKNNEAEGKEYVFKPVTVPATNGHHGESQADHDGFSTLDLDSINSHINFGSQQNEVVKTVAGEGDEMESLTESESIHSLADSDTMNGSNRSMRKRKNDSPINNSPSPGKRGKKGVNLQALPPNSVYVEHSERPFVCGTGNCTWAFKQLFHLQRHHNKVHGGKSQNSSGRSSVTGSSVSTSTGEAIYQQALNELVVEYPSEYVQV